MDRPDQLNRNKTYIHAFLTPESAVLDMITLGFSLPELFSIHSYNKNHIQNQGLEQ